MEPADDSLEQPSGHVVYSGGNTPQPVAPAVIPVTQPSAVVTPGSTVAPTPAYTRASAPASEETPVTVRVEPAPAPGRVATAASVMSPSLAVPVTSVQAAPLMPTPVPAPVAAPTPVAPPASPVAPLTPQTPLSSVSEMADDSLETIPDAPNAATEPEINLETNQYSGTRRASLLRFNRSAFTLTLVTLLLVSLTTLGGFMLFKPGKDPKQTASQTGSFAVGSLEVGSLRTDATLGVGEAGKLEINGTLQANNGFILTPTDQPVDPSLGQFYLSNTNRQVFYHNGTRFVGLATDDSLIALAGQQDAANQTLLAAIAGNRQITEVGVGLSLNGSALSNTGVTSITGTAGQILVSSATGAVQLSLPDLAFGGLIYGGGPGGALGSVATGSSGQCLLSQGGGQAPAFGNCPGIQGNGTVFHGASTVGRIPKFTANDTIADSLIADDGTTVSVDGNLAVTGTKTLTVGTGATLLNGTLTVNGTTGLNSNVFITGDTAIAQQLIVTSLATFNGGVTVGSNSSITQTGSGTLSTGTGNVSLNGNTSITGSNTFTVGSGASTFGGAVNINGAVTVGAGNNFVQNGTGTFTTGSGLVALNGATTVASTLTVQGATASIGTAVVQGSLVLNSGNGQLATVRAISSLAQNTVYTLPDPGAAAATICLSTGNCAGAGAGITGSGTAGRLAKFSTSNNIADSGLSEAGTTATYAGNLVVNAATAFVGNLLDLQLNGISKLRVTESGNTTVGGSLAVTSLATLNNGLNVTAGGAAITGNSSVTGTLGVSSALTVSAGGISVTGNSSIAGNLTGLTGLTSAGTITFSGLNTAGVVHTSATGVLSTGAVLLGTETSGNYVSALGTLTGLTTTGNGVAGSTPTLSVTYGSGTNTSAQGSTALSFSGSGNLTGTVSGTAGGGFTANTLDVVSSPTFAGNLTVQGVAGITVGTTTQTGKITLNSGSGLSNQTGSLQVVSSLAQTTTYTLPDPGAASATICLSTGNCAGAGGGITGSGTVGALAKFNGTGSITSSTLSESGTTLTASGSVAIQGTGGLTLGVSSTTDGSLTFRGAAGLNTVSLQAPATNPASNLVFRLPAAYGSSGYCLQSDGTGGLSFQPCTGGSAGGVTSLNSQTGVLTLANSTGSASVITIDNASTTAKGIAQFNATNFTATSGAINTIQDIAVSSSPSFTGLTLSGNLAVTGTSTLSGAITGGTFNGQTISSAANFTGTLNVATGYQIGGLAATGNFLRGNGTNFVSSAIQAGDVPSGSNFYIQNGTGVQAGSNFNISGNGTIGTNLSVAGTSTLTGAITGGTFNGQTISSAANFTGTLAVAGAATITGQLNANGGIVTNNANIISGNGTITSYGDINANRFIVNSSLIKSSAIGTGGVNANDVVVLVNDVGASKVTQTTTARDPRVFGVAANTYASGTSGNIAIGGVANINVDTAAVAIGDQLVTSATAGRATVDNNATTGIIGYATSAKAAGSNGTVTARIQVTTGQYSPVFRNSTDSTSAFNIQNAAGTNLFLADTTNGRVGVTANTTLTLDGGSSAQLRLSSSDHGLLIGNYYANGYTYIQSNEFMIQNTIDYSTNFKVDGTGSALFKNRSDNAAAFRIQNASAVNVLVVDTSSGRIAVGASAVPASGVLTVGTNTTAATGGLYFGTDTNLYRSATNRLMTDAALQVAGNVGIGTTPSANSKLYVQDLSLTAGAYREVSVVNAYQSGASASYSGITGFNSYATTAVTGAGNGQAFGIIGSALTSNDGTDAQGAIGVQGKVTTRGLNDYGYALMATQDTASTAGTAYGLYINLTDTDTTRFGVYQNSANPNYLAGNIGIGTTTTTNGQLNLAASTSATGGVAFGTDTNLYRAAADTLKTDDALIVGTLAGTGTTALCVTGTNQLSTCGTGGGGSNYVVNGTGLQTSANFYIQAANSTTTGTVGGIIRGAAGGQTVDLLQLMNTAGTVLTHFDANGNLAVGTASAPGYAVDVNGDVNIAAGQSFRIGGVAICGGTTCAPASGSGSYIQNGTTLQTNANFFIQSTGTTNVSGIIRQNTSQTSDLLQFQNSAGTILTAIQADGKIVFGPSGAQDTNLYRTAANTLRTDDSLEVAVNADITGRLSVGSQASDDATKALNVSHLFTGTSGTLQGTFSRGWAAPALASSAQVRGITGEALVDSSTSSNITGSMTGVYGYANHSGSGTLSEGTAGRFLADKNSTGPITNAYGLYSEVRNTNAIGAIQNAYGLYIADSTETGVITNDYGVYQADTSAMNYLGGNLGLGVTNPTTAKLEFATSTTASGGILFGADTNLYRSAADVLTTDDNLAVTGYIRSSAQIHANLGAATQVKVGTVNSTQAGLEFGSAGDTNLYRSAANTLQTDDSLIVQSPAVGAVVLAVKAAASQTGDLVQLHDSSGNVNAKFGPNGSALTLGRIAATGTVTAGTLTFADGTLSNFGITLQSATLSNDQTVTIPNATGTICLQNSVSCGFAASTGGAGYINNQSASPQSANFFIQSAAVGSVGGIIRGASSQTANLFEIQNSSGTILGRYDSNGQLFAASSIKIGPSAGTSDILAGVAGNLIIRTFNDSTPGIVIRGNSATQSADLLTAADHNGTAKFRVLAGGGAIVSGLPTGGGYTFTATDGGGTTGTVLIQGSGGQGNPLLDVKNSGGTTLTQIASTGDVNLGGRVLNAYASIGGTLVGSIGYGQNAATTGVLQLRNVAARPIEVLSADAGTIAMNIRGASSQTGDLLQFQNSAGTVLARVLASGRYQSDGAEINNLYKSNTNTNVLATNSAGYSIDVRGGGASEVTQRILAAASQTADLLQFQNSSGTVIARFYSSGNLSVRSDGAGSINAGTIQPGSAANLNLASNGAANAVWISPAGATGLATFLNADPHLQITSQAAANRVLLLRGAASQTADLLQFQNSSGSVLSKISSGGLLSVGSSTTVTNGVAYFNGNVGIGTQPGANTGLFVSKDFSSSPVDQSKVADFFGTANPSANFNGIYGIANAFVVSPATGTTTSYLQAGVTQAYFGGGGGTVTTLTGQMLRTAVTGASPTGTVTNGRTIDINSIANQASGTPGVTFNTQTGIYVANQGAGSGTNGLTIQNAVGIDVLAQNTASTSNIGVRIGPASTYSLQLSDTGGTAAGGITFGTDVQLFRESANRLALAAGDELKVPGRVLLNSIAGSNQAYFTANDSMIGSSTATGTTGTTTGTGTNTTTLTLTTDAFAVNDVVLIDNVGQDYYTRITADPGTGSYTVEPAITFETTRTVTKYSIQNIGATLTDYTSNSSKFFQGNFLGQLTVGTGTTKLSDGLLQFQGDTNLYRSGADNLKTDDTLRAGQNIVAQDALAGQVVIGARGPLSEAGISFGSANDTNLYRTQANRLMTDDDFTVAGTLRVSTSFNFTGVTITIAGDTNLYRSAANTLRTDDTLSVGGNASVVGSVAIGGYAGSNKLGVQGGPIELIGDSSVMWNQAVYYSKDTAAGTGRTFAFGSRGGNFSISDETSAAQRFIIDLNGRVNITATGSTGGLLLGTDTNLYRSAANTLKTDDRLQVVTGLDLQSDTGLDANGLRFGSASDVILYRQSAGQLHIKSATNTALRLYSTGTNTFNGSANHYIDLNFNNATSASAAMFATLQVGTNVGSSNLGIQAYGGNVGIGTTNMTNGLLNLGTNTTTASGGLYLGTDTNLYRSAVNTLKTDGHIRAVGALIANDGTASQINIGSSAGIITFGSAADTNLYRSAANTLSTDDQFNIKTNSTNALLIEDTLGQDVVWADTTNGRLNVQGAGGFMVRATDGTNNLQINSTGAVFGKSSIEVQRATTGNNAFLTQVAGDAGYRLQIQADGAINWGDGAGTFDTNLYRSAADYLRTTATFDILQTSSSAFAVRQSTGGVASFLVNTSANAVSVNNGADLQGYNGDFAAQTFNIDAATGIAQLGSSVTSSGILNIGTNTTTAAGGIYLGTDTNLYRSAAGALTTSSTGDVVLELAADTDNVTETDNPLIKLTQDGGTTIGQLGLTGSAGSIFTNSLSNAAFFGTAGADALQLITNNVAALTIDSTGRVGIGDTTPNNTLDVQSTTTTATLEVKGVGNATNFARLQLSSDEVTDKIWELSHRQDAGNTNKLLFSYFDGASWVSPLRIAPDQTYVRTTTNSTTGFQVQNAAGSELLTVDTTGSQVLLGKASTVSGKLTFQNSLNANTVSIVPSTNQTSSYTLMLPNTLGAAGQCLQLSDNTGTLGWGSCYAGTGATSSVASASYARAYSNANQSIATGTWTAITLNTETQDTDGYHDVTTNNTRFTAPTSGYYSISGSVQFAPNGTGERRVGFRVNGTSSYYGQTTNLPSASFDTPISSTTDIYLNAGDYVEMLAFQSSGVALNSQAASDAYPMMSIVKNNGGAGGSSATGGSGQLDQARAYKSTTTSVGAAVGTQLSLDSERFDNNDLHNSSAPTRFTIKKAGVYSISASISLSATVPNNNVNVGILKNGSVHLGLNSIATGGQTGTVSHTGIYLNAGDYIELYVGNNSTSGVIVEASQATAQNYSAELAIAQLPDWMGGTGFGSGSATSGYTGVEAYNNATISHSNTGNWQTIALNSERQDTNNLHDTVTNNTRLTAPVSGMYSVHGQLSYAPNGTGTRAIAVSKNGSSNFIVTDSRPTSTDGFGPLLSTSTQIYLNAGDYVELHGFQNSGGNLDITYNQDFSPNFGMTLMNAGGSGSGASSSSSSGVTVPQVRAYNTSGPTLTTGVMTAVPLEAELYDTDIMHDTSSNTRVTFKTAGCYNVAAGVTFNTSNAGQRTAMLRLNGSTVIAETEVTNASTANFTQMPVTTNYCFNAGDYVELVVSQNSGGNLTLVVQSSVSSGAYISATRTDGGVASGLLSGGGTNGASYARVYNNANLGAYTNGSFNNLTFNSESTDTDNYHDSSTNTDRLTAPVSGLYQINSNVTWDAAAGGYRKMYIKVNGNTVATQDTVPTGSGTFTAQSVSTSYYLNKGDYVQIQVYQNSGGSLLLLNQGIFSPEADIMLISGGGGSSSIALGSSQSTPSDEVRAYNPSGTNLSIANAIWTPVTLAAEEYDSNNLHDTVSNTSRITFKSAGTYEITGNADFAANSTGIRYFRLVKNGTTDIAYVGAQHAGAADSMGNITTTARFNAGDYVEMHVYQNTGSALTLWGTQSSTWLVATKLSGGSGSSTTLQGAYDASANPAKIQLAAGKPMVLQAASGTTDTNLFQIQKSDGTAFFNADTTNGRIGIGTASPTLRLHSNGTDGLPASSGSSQVGALRLQTGSGNNVLDFGVYSATGASWIQATDSTNLATNRNLLLNPNGGSVGIGTTSPQSTLHVSGASPNYAANLRVGGDASTLFGVVTDYTQAGTTTGTIYSSPGYANAGVLLKLGAGSGNTNQLVLEGSGEIGIGTATPTAPLEVSDPTSNNGIRITSGAGASALNLYTTDTTAGNRNWRIANRYNNFGSLDFMYSSTLGGTPTTLAMTINSSGNVGINTTSPLNQLHVYSGAIAASSNADNNDFIRLRMNTVNNTYGVLESMWDNNSGLPATIAINPNGGKVAVGTTAPAGILTVANATAGQDLFNVHNTANNALFIFNPANGLSEGWNAAESVMYVGKATTNNRSINAAGSINASGADYAEMVPWSGVKPAVGSVVLYKGSNYVVSSRATAAFVGGDINGLDETNSIILSFAGQVPVRVTGPVAEGDLLLPNGDGTAKAINPAQATINEVLSKVAIAQETNSNPGVKSVQGAVGTTGSNIAASLQQNSATFASLNVSGNTTVQNLTVVGSATIGTLHVTGSAQFSGDITVGSHIITAGDAPITQAMTAAGTGATVAIDGNDIAGTITITTGANGTAAGDLAKILFKKQYGKAPRIILSAQDGKSAQAFIYPTAKTKDDFLLKVDAALQANATYIFDYFIAQ